MLKKKLKKKNTILDDWQVVQNKKYWCDFMFKDILQYAKKFQFLYQF